VSRLGLVECLGEESIVVLPFHTPQAIGRHACIQTSVKRFVSMSICPQYCFVGIIYMENIHTCTTLLQLIYSPHLLTRVMRCVEIAQPIMQPSSPQLRPPARRHHSPHAQALPKPPQHSSKPTCPSPSTPQPSPPQPPPQPAIHPSTSYLPT
jgi:hypothetical protein